MKKIIIPIIVVLMILTIIILVVGNKEQQKDKQEIKNIKVTTQTFTLTDNGTEIEVKLKNNSAKEITIKHINITLSDSQNKKITTIGYNKKTTIKDNKEKTIKIVDKEKYPSTTNIKYKLTK